MRNSRGHAHDWQLLIYRQRLHEAAGSNTKVREEFYSSNNRRLNMVRINRLLVLALATVFLTSLGAGRAAAQTVIVTTPRVSYYYAPPVVAYSSPPVVYASAPRVAYYYPPAVSYYTPAVSYYAPTVTYAARAVPVYAAPVAVTTTRYGFFGRPRVTTYYYR
jgi:hypothetical protein